MDPQREIPEYRLKFDAFFEPNLLPKGSTVRWDGEPSDALEPLNKAAWERLEAWYDLDVPELDRQGKLTGATVKIRSKLRPAPYMPSEVHTAEVTALPEPGKETPMSLAEAMNSNRKGTDQRPAPIMQDNRAIYRPEGDSGLNVETSAPGVELLSPGTSTLPTPRRT